MIMLNIAPTRNQTLNRKPNDFFDAVEASATALGVVEGRCLLLFFLSKLVVLWSLCKLSLKTLSSK